MIADANGIKNAVSTTKDNRMKATLYLMVFRIVICSGPKNNGDVKAADGVQHAMVAAKDMTMAKAAMFVSPDDSKALIIIFSLHGKPGQKHN